MSQTWLKVGAAVTFLAALLQGLSTIAAVFDDPTYGLVGTVIAAVFCSVFLYGILTSAKEDRGTIVDSSGKPLVGRRHKYSKPERYVARAALLAMGLGVAYTAYSVVRRASTDAAADQVNLDSYPTLSEHASLVSVRGVRWLTRGEADVDGWGVVSICRDHRGKTCWVYMDVSTQGARPVKVDALGVTVIEYVANPSLSPRLLQRYFRLPVAYYHLRISPNAARGAVQATFLANRGGDDAPEEVVYVDARQPETLALNINAAKGGLYRVQVEMFVSAAGETQRLLVDQESDLLF